MMSTAHSPKPPWLKVKIQSGENYLKVLDTVNLNKLHTVCQEALCPNISECWNKGTATFMILGDVCTRSCGFCAVKTGKPPVYDEGEPERVAQAIRAMGVKYAVLTSVNRDERLDGGALIWAAAIRESRRLNPGLRIEALTPDFKGNWEALKTVLEAGPDVFAHNLETVPRLYRPVRPQANYRQSLWVLEQAKKYGATTKTSIMLGLGESFDEVLTVMRDAAGVGVAIFTIGQYLQPTKQHLPVARFVPPQEFDEYKRAGLSLGLGYVEAGPLVRSSYHAEEQNARLAA